MFLSGNGIFKNDKFRTDLRNNNQSITFCAVGKHHQNSVAENYRRTMIYRARTVLTNDHER